MDKIIIKDSKFSSIILFLISLAISIGMVLYFQTDPSIVGDMFSPEWTFVIITGIFTIYYFWRMIDSTPKIIIDEIGIFNKYLGAGIIPWEDMKSVQLRKIQKKDYISIDVHNPDYFLSQMNFYRKWLYKANQSLGFVGFHVDISGIDIQPEDMLRMVLIRKEHGTNQSSKRQSYYDVTSSREALHVLGLTDSASKEQIEFSYKELIKEYHPDKYVHLGIDYQRGAEIQFKKIQQAYNYLKSID